MPAPLRSLPHRDARELELVCEVDRYDGPISGLVRAGDDELLWFDWDADDPEPSRVFALHATPAGAGVTAAGWLERYQALHDELVLVANPHAYPISDRQRRSLRPQATVEAELRAHHAARPRWEEGPPIGWFAGTTADYGAITTVTLDSATGARLEPWQREVARALAGEDQGALDRLFADPPLPAHPLDVYFVHRPTPPHDCVVRDFRGQPLPEDHVMTARHRVQCFDALLLPARRR